MSLVPVIDSPPPIVVSGFVELLQIIHLELPN